MAKKVLGRGLGAYFPDLDDKESQKKSTKSQNDREGTAIQDKLNVTLHIPVNNIRPNPHQPRQDFDEFSLQELSESIRKHGLIQPVTVRQVADKRYELISGERRLRATKMAGLKEIPAYIRDVNDDDIIAFALIENVQREELNPVEVALGYKRLIEECGYTQEQVAKHVDKNRTTVTNLLRLLNLPAAVQAALKEKKISTGHARSLINVEDPKTQEKLLQRCIEEDYSVRQLEDAVRKAAQSKKQRTKSAPSKDQKDIHLIEISNRLRKKLSTKVEIKKKKQGGEIKIDYYSDEELDRILSMLDHDS